jgi:membrane associated rhomboid family serine protease
MFREIRAFFCVVAGIMIAGLGVLAMIGKPSSEAGCAILLGAACVWWGRKLMYATQEDLEAAQTAQTNVPQKIERAMLSVQVGDAKLQSHLNRNHLWLTLAIVALNALVFYMVNVKHGFGLKSLPTDLALASGADFAPLTGRGQIWRTFTCLFLHGNFAHLLGNMVALLILGRYVEYYFGRANLLLFYVAGGIAGNLASNAIYPAVASYGASGSVFALYGAVIMYFFVGRTQASEKMPLSMYSQLYLAQHAARSLYSGFMTPGVDNAAHLLGLIAGAAMAYFFFELKLAFSRMAGVTAAILLTIIIGMHFTVYPKTPTMASIQARHAQAKDLEEITRVAFALRDQLQMVGQAHDQLRAGQMSEHDFVERSWKMEIKPALKRLRNEAYRIKTTNRKTYGIQSDLYRSVTAYESYFTTLIETKDETVRRSVASQGQSHASVVYLKRTLEALEAAGAIARNASNQAANTN